MKLLSELITSNKFLENWNERNVEAFKELYGADKGRYAAKAEKTFRLRASDYKGESSAAPFLH